MVVILLCLFPALVLRKSPLFLCTAALFKTNTFGYCQLISVWPHIPYRVDFYSLQQKGLQTAAYHTSYRKATLIWPWPDQTRETFPTSTNAIASIFPYRQCYRSLHAFLHAEPHMNFLFWSPGNSTSFFKSQSDLSFPCETILQPPRQVPDSLLPLSHFHTSMAAIISLSIIFGDCLPYQTVIFLRGDTVSFLCVFF